MDKMPYSFSDMMRKHEGRSNGITCADDSAVPGCINTNFCLSTPEDKSGILTMVFMDMQPLDSIYSPETAFCNGTLFPNIDKPFNGGMYR